MSELLNLPNIRQMLEAQLLQTVVDTPEKLKEIGSKQAWLNIRQVDNSACYNRLCALEGAIKGVRWHFLTEDEKKDLKEFYKSFIVENT